MSAKITIVIELDDAAWNWELHGPDRLGGETWDSKPEDIVDDCMDYCSGWRLNNTGGDPLFGNVKYVASLEVVG